MSRAEFDLDLIERYDGRGPRYTSYPTAVQFHEGFGESDYRQQAKLSSLRRGNGPLSIYVHIPFCHSLCYYCGCSKIVTRNPARAERYLESLEREIALQGALFSREREVIQLHFGGGTPTYLDQAQRQRLMSTLRDHFSLSSRPNREFSIEVDPRTVTPDDISELSERGFNRISLGVQDFAEEVQRAVNRIQSPEETRALVEAARAVGFGSVSLDLIYGLPLQSVAGFDRTLDQVLAMRPDRLAIYNYAHMPHMFRSQKMIPEEQIPAPSVKLQILRHAIEKLEASGYLYIGMDHFALEHDELVQAQQRGELQRNFQGYSTYGDCDLIGIGMTAIGHVGNAFSQNAREIEAYQQALDQNRLPIVRGTVLSDDDQIRGAVIQEIMCQGRLDFAALSERLMIDFGSYFADLVPSLQQLHKDGLLDEYDDTHLTVSNRGRLLLRSIAMVFDRYLSEKREAKSFSKII